MFVQQLGMLSKLDCEKFSNINGTLKRAIGIPVNWHNSTGILTSTARAILVKVPVEMFQFTGIPMTHFTVSFRLQNFSQLLSREFEFEHSRECSNCIVSEVLVNWRISSGILTMISEISLSKCYHLKVCQLTAIAVTCFESF